PDAGDNQWLSVAYGNGTFVAVAGNGTDRVMTSTDNGLTWTARSAPLAGWGGVTYGNGTFVAVASGGGVTTSTDDGVTWTAQTAPNSAWRAVTFANGTFVAVSTGGAVMTSTDGLDWDSRTAPEANGWIS